MGGCVGGTLLFDAVKMAPGRVAAAVLQNPIGLHENRDTWEPAVNGYGEMLGAAIRRSRPSIDAFGRNMFGRYFVFSVTRDFVRHLPDALFSPARHRQAASRPDQ